MRFVAFSITLSKGLTGHDITCHDMTCFFFPLSRCRCSGTSGRGRGAGAHQPRLSFRSQQPPSSLLHGDRCEDLCADGRVGHAVRWLGIALRERWCTAYSTFLGRIFGVSIERPWECRNCNHGSFTLFVHSVTTTSQRVYRHVATTCIQFIPFDALFASLAL